MRANITNYSICMRSNSAEFSKYLCLSKLVNICCFFFFRKWNNAYAQDIKN